eukprot:NODE_4854_length_622_cov_58.172775_g4179_i0.p2 GENE.NODE_4854_length_622_cov_58.172775_g4179_i0~~NODE_4854_length_622_cov_58.172775_g4179_i0.p2  ORF type:complete len:114 (+),score=21.36 NODE_4854_length_622_cov_58.172775_g4179_i0:271-612(+)
MSNRTSQTPLHSISLDRVPRIAAQVVQSRSYYPLVPGLPEAQVDFSHQRFFEFDGNTPDLVVLPSVLPPFAVSVNGAVVLNPGSVSKRSFAELTVLPLEGGARDSLSVEFFRA